MTSQTTEKYAWAIIESFFKTKGLVHQQLDSFNHYLRRGIPSVLEESDTITIQATPKRQYVLRFHDVSYNPPSIVEDNLSLRDLLPSEARRRDLTYDATICCSVTETLQERKTKTATTYTPVEQKVHHRVAIGRTPVMLRSSLCHLSKMSAPERGDAGECLQDVGGYFVIKGNERVIVSQLRGAYNRVIVLQCPTTDKHLLSAEVRSMSVETGHSVLAKALLPRDGGSPAFSLPYIAKPIPAGIVFKALGYSHDDLLRLVNVDSKHAERLFRRIERTAYVTPTQQDALTYIGKRASNGVTKGKCVAYATQVLNNELFPHMGVHATPMERAMFLGYMLKKLIETHLGMRSTDDRDHYDLKRVETCGILCTELFRTLFKRYCSSVKLHLEKRRTRFEALPILTSNHSITTGLRHSFSTGNWGAQKNSYIRMGVSQVMSRMTYGATLSHMRRVVIPIRREGKNSKIRRIHASQYGFICPSETPEGSSAGIVLNYALTTSVSHRAPFVVVKEAIRSCSELKHVEDLEPSELKGMTPVFLNGHVLGATTDPEAFTDRVKVLRRTGVIQEDVSIAYDDIDEEIRIASDEGRFMRPLFRLERGALTTDKALTDWNGLIDAVGIEYVDVAEVETSVVAPRIESISSDYDYAEIHPAMMLGVMASIIPFPDHSPSPRNCYQCSMGKQALGIYATSFKGRTDTMAHLLHYPQKPLVSTKASRLLGFDDMPSGINAIVAVMSYTGYNQEDSVIINQSAIERGLFNVTSFRTVTDSESRGSVYSFETIEVPPVSDSFRRKIGNYSLLDDRGVVRKGVKVFPGDILVGKVHTQSAKSGEIKKTDVSLVAKAEHEGVVDEVYWEQTIDGCRLVKIVIRKLRVPEIGDKFASRAAQKGTVGITYRQEDMPFNEDGICPDIIINPHCIPSRMTVNQLMETVLGKACAIEGTFGDATPFSSDRTSTAEDICQQLADAGMDSLSGASERTGWETMYNGFTGEKVKAKVFMGPTYYQRLKHMVSDKMHARARGQVTTLTRQPLEGRSRGGGLRFGEMERDCMIAHGASRFLKERLFDCSDPFNVDICDKCGTIVSGNKFCTNCKTDRVVSCNMPYAAKLLCQELTAMGIKMTMRPVREE